MLDGLVSGSVALLAGGGPTTAITLGAAMTVLQLGIGTVNDIVDAPRDRGKKAGKPIPAGLVDPAHAAALAVACFATGVVLALAVDVRVAVLAVVVIGIGLAYDLWLKGTAWSWAPFAVGIPILPVFGWLGARASLPPAFGLLIPVAIAAGAGLAIANALVDIERDRAAGASSLAARLGRPRADVAVAGLFAAVGASAVVSAVVFGGPTAQVLLVAGSATVPVVAARWAIGRDPAGRERAWQAEAVGLAALAAAWIWLIRDTGALA